MRVCQVVATYHGDQAYAFDTSGAGVCSNAFVRHSSGNAFDEPSGSYFTTLPGVASSHLDEPAAPKETSAFSPMTIDEPLASHSQDATAPTSPALSARRVYLDSSIGGSSISVAKAVLVGTRDPHPQRCRRLYALWAVRADAIQFCRPRSAAATPRYSIFGTRFSVRRMTPHIAWTWRSHSSLAASRFLSLVKLSLCCTFCRNPVSASTLFTRATTAFPPSIWCAQPAHAILHPYVFATSVPASTLTRLTIAKRLVPSTLNGRGEGTRG